MASTEFEQILGTMKQWLGSLSEQPNQFDIQTLRTSLDMNFVPVPDTVEIEPVDAGGVPAEWIHGPGALADRRLLYLHGGGYVAGGLGSHRPLAGRISMATGCWVLLIDYRLAPEHPFPAAVDDATAAYRWMSENGPSGQSRAANTFIAGDSAGGGLTLATLLTLRDAGNALPDAAITLSPWTDLAVNEESMKTRASTDPFFDASMLPILPLMTTSYVGEANPQNPLVSPLYGDPTGFPPLLMQVGGAETLLDDSTKFAEKAKAVGVQVTLEVWPEMFHVWQALAPMFPEAQQAIDRIGEFIQPFK